MFPTLALAPPRAVLQAPSSSSGRVGKMRVTKSRPAAGAGSARGGGESQLPGLLKTSKPSIAPGKVHTADDFLAFVGFNATHVYFDGETIKPMDPAHAHAHAHTRTLNQRNNEPKQTVVDLGLQAAMNEVDDEVDLAGSPTDTARTRGDTREGSPSKKKKDGLGKRDPVVDELRTYTVMLDKFSLHNFMIYNGQALRDTPEFHSFRRTYNHEWGSISVIIAQLEKLMREYSVKLAIINGPCVYDLASLNLVSIEREELVMCISNIDQVRPQLKSVFGNTGGDADKDLDDGAHKHLAATLIQKIIRRFTATRRVQRLRLRISSAILIQSVARRMIYRRVGVDRLRVWQEEQEGRWSKNKATLQSLWQRLQEDTSSSTSSGSASQKRLVIHVPSITAAEYLRIDMNNIRAMQNAQIACLAQLADPDVTLVYVTPCPPGPEEIVYHDKFLAMLGVSTLPKRLHFIVPEMLPRLPHHLSLAQVLWCSPVALRRIKGHIKRFPNCSYIVPASVGWVEKRLAISLNVPLLAPSPTLAETIRSRSYSKRIFTSAGVNLPVGAHDIYSTEDLFVAVTRLIACNLHVRRWVLRLNYDFNGESACILDTNKIGIVATLRAEQKLLFESSNNQTSSWFTKNVQLSVRRRLLENLTTELPSSIFICRRDLYRSWDKYQRHMQRTGLVIEAEPIEPLGMVDSMCFIDPLGNTELHGGADVVTDDRHQAQSFVAPQSRVPRAALEGATRAVAKQLHDTLGVIGFVTLRFSAFWDGLDNIPRVWAVGLHLGMTPLLGALTTVAVATQPGVAVPRSLIPALPSEGSSADFSPLFLSCRNTNFLNHPKPSQTRQVRRSRALGHPRAASGQSRRRIFQAVPHARNRL